MQSFLLRSNEDVFNYTELRFDEQLLGFGARVAEFGPGFKLFAATSSGFYEEREAKKYANYNSLVRSSVSASGYKLSFRQSSFSGGEKYSDQN